MDSPSTSTQGAGTEQPLSRSASDCLATEAANTLQTLLLFPDTAWYDPSTIQRSEYVYRT
jgi:hypothetical protein